MGMVTLAKANVDFLKKAIRQIYPSIKSSHASEAIAFALGFRTYAALLAAIEREPLGRRGWVWLDGNRLIARLRRLSYDGIRSQDVFALIDGLNWPVTFDSQVSEKIERIKQSIQASVRNANDN